MQQLKLSLPRKGSQFGRPQDVSFDFASRSPGTDPIIGSPSEMRFEEYTEGLA